MSATAPPAFEHITWGRNPFRVIERTPSALVFIVKNLMVNGSAHQQVKFHFEKPTSEWAMLWDGSKNDWISHPDPSAPIGSIVSEGFAKSVGAMTKYSFGGHHSLGPSRWGFAARVCKIET